MGDTMKKLQKEEKAMSTYIKNKEQEDKKEEERRQKMLKMKNLETKKVLDRQLAEKEDQQRLLKFEEEVAAVYLKKDVEQFNEVETRKKQQVDMTLKEHSKRLVNQIEDKKKPKQPDHIDLHITKTLLEGTKKL